MIFAIISPKQITDQIGVNYKTVHHYRDVFEEFMKIQFAGRRVKYLPENADIFCKILELKDEGYSNADIHGILKVSNSEGPKVDLSDGISDPLSEGPSDLLASDLSDSPSEGLSDLPDCNLWMIFQQRERTKIYPNRPGRMKTIQPARIQTKLDWLTPVRMWLPRSRPVWIIQEGRRSTSQQLQCPGCRTE